MASIQTTKALEKTLAWSRFVDEYLKDYDPEGAYLRTYGGELSSSTRRRGEAIMDQPWVYAEIVRRAKDRLRPRDVTKNRVLLEMARVAFSDIRNTIVTDDKGNQRPRMISELDEDTARACAGYEYSVNGDLKIKMADKMGALTTLARITGVLQPQSAKVTHNHVLSTAHAHGSADEVEIMMLLAESTEDVIDVEPEGDAYDGIDPDE